MRRDTFVWTCPVCFRPLDAPGLVPCFFRSCETPHLICIECVPDLLGRCCPRCREVTRVPVPLADLVSAFDGVVRARMRLLSLSSPRCLRAERVQYVLSQVQGFVGAHPSGLRPETVLALCVPGFEGDRFGAGSSADRVGRLNLLYADLQPALDAALCRGAHTVTVCPLAAGTDVAPGFYMCLRVAPVGATHTPFLSQG